MGPTIEHSFRGLQIREGGGEGQSQPTSRGDPTETLWSESNTSKEPSSRYDIKNHDSTTSVKERTAAFEERQNESTTMREKKSRGNIFQEHQSFQPSQLPQPPCPPRPARPPQPPLPEPEVDKAKARQFQTITNMLTNRGKDATIFKDLEPFFPFEMSIQDLFTNVDEDSKEVVSNIPFKMLSQIIKKNFEGRNCLQEIDKSTKDKSTKVPKKSRAERRVTQQLSLPSPQDIFMVSFMSCDPMLQQLLVEKMFMAKLAVPFLFRSPFDPERHFLPCWSYKSTHLEWRGKEINSVEHRAKTVSFVRLGRPAISKSALINEILSENKHDIFFNRNCPQGGEKYKQILSEGSVEMAWFLPTGKDDEVSNDATRVLNLRGDVAVFEKEFESLSQVSDKIVLLIEPGKILEAGETSSIVIQIRSMKDKIVYLWTERDDSIEYQEQVDEALKMLERGDGEADLFEGDAEDTHHFKEMVTQRVKEELAHKSLFQAAGKTHLEIVEILGKEMAGTMDTDVEIPDCKLGTSKAETILSRHLRGKKLSDCKTKYLPLQSSKLWIRWSELEKKRVRTSKENILGSADCGQYTELQAEMDDIRKNQKKKGVSFFLKDLIKTMRCLKGNIRTTMVFLQTIKLYLDSETQKCMPKLRKTRKEKWNLLRKGENAGEESSLKREYEDVVQEIADSSFGLEHIFREIGQIYESLHFAEALKENDHFGADLPALVANLIVYGSSFEIMDGDASNIPRIWLREVFKALDQHEKVRGKKGQTVSVLGIQSSGKSTLLNSMFGANFSVSAGRCTCGVFMKMIPANRKERELGKVAHDFLLVIDTEGLNAPELLDADRRGQRDNELATLAVGLGNMSLINLKGENIAELKDVLQIVVLAFLRMNVSRGQNLESSKKNIPGCMFLHQNVAAVNAKDKMQEGLQKLVGTLDLATKEAAETEKIPYMTTFDQVIFFETANDKHVVYFPGLWKGDPPMAPVNPGYSKQSDITRTLMEEHLTSRRWGCREVMDIFDQIYLLWNGILTENFVFNFKNSLCINAYDHLERKFKELTNHLKKIYDEWRSIKEVEVKKLEEKAELRNMFCFLQASIDTDESEKEDKIHKDFEEFFNESEFSDILTTWKADKIVALKEKGASEK